MGLSIHVPIFGLNFILKHKYVEGVLKIVDTSFNK